MTKAAIPIAGVPRGAPPLAIRTKAPTQPSQAEPKGRPATETTPTRSFDNVLTSAREQPEDAAEPTAQPTPERAEDAPSEAIPADETAPAEGADSEEAPKRPQLAAPEIAPPPAAQNEIPAAPARPEHANSPANHQLPAPSVPQTGEPVASTLVPLAASTSQPSEAQATPRSQETPLSSPTAALASNVAAPESDSTPAPAQPQPQSEPVPAQTAPVAVQPQPRRQASAEPGSRRTPEEAVFSLDTNDDPVSDVRAAPADQPRPETHPATPPAPHTQSPQSNAAHAPLRNTDSIFQLESALHAPDASPAPDPNARQPSPAPADVAKPAPAPAPASLEAPPAPQLVTRGLTAALAQRGGVVHVRLVPVSLGEVRIQMNLNAGSVSVAIDAATPAAQQLLNDHLGMLRSSLESRGLQVDRLAVNLAPTQAAPASPANSSHQNQSNADFNQSSAHHNQQDAAGSQSRGRSDDEPPGRGPGATHDPDEPLGSSHHPRNFGARLRMRLSTVA